MFAAGKTDGAVSAVVNYIEDVFSTYLYTGNGSTQTITNGIDLSTKGGLVWFKSRSTINSHRIFDTARGVQKFLNSSDTGAQTTNASTLTAFNSTGFDIGSSSVINTNAELMASWTFRKQPKFFDVVTYTGNGLSAQQIAHSLGSVPGCVIVKATSTTSDWGVWHRGNGTTDYTGLSLNGTGASVSSGYGAGFTSTYFTPRLVEDASYNVGNLNGVTYVAYIFAHDAGGFGLTGTDNVISCGSFTASAGGLATVNLGYEPQWILMKPSTTASSGNWIIADTMRGLICDSPGGAPNVQLYANLSNAEGGGAPINITSTGFEFNTLNSNWYNQTFIYIAIRRGPMKVPTSGTSVFKVPYVRTGGGSTQDITGASYPVNDLVVTKSTSNTQTWAWTDRLRGATQELTSAATTAETTYANDLTSFAFNTGFQVGSGAGGQMNTSGYTYIDYTFRRAPSFFDEVCYTGTGTAGQTYTHNLGVVPELMIVKGRSIAEEWNVYFGNNTNYLKLNRNDVPQTATTRWNDTSPTSSVFSVGTSNWVNASGSTYVAYLFASLAGVSKVFSYTGNGSSQTINCGFTGGARFVLIKRTDAIGNWYVWDSARGIVSGNDPYLSLNTTAAEVTTDDSVDTDSTGFVVNQVSATNVNVSSATYIGIAIA